MTTLVSDTISTDDTFTDAVRLEGYFNVSIQSGGSFTTATTVTVQRSIDNSTWYDVDDFTAPTEEYGFEPELMWYRIGVKSGNLNAGESVVVRIGREDEDRH